MCDAKHQENNVHFVCGKCGNRFQYKRNLYSHMKQHFRNKGSNKKTAKHDIFDHCQFFCEECEHGYASKVAALNCTHNSSYYLRNSPHDLNVTTQTDQREDNLMEIKISFVSENRANQTIPLYELHIPVVETTSREIDIQHTKPALGSENNDIKPVILVQALTTPLNSSKE